jgi:hypothetical protein
MEYTVLIRKLFWRVCLPFFLISTVWCVMNQVNLLEHPLFLTSGISLLPMMMIKSFEMQDGLKDKHVHEFREMGATEFLNFMDEFKKIPLGSYRGICKEAYREEYLRRYGKDIFHEIPMFRSK